MIFERSAGAVLFYRNLVIEYLLLRYGAGHWDFPKGEIEPGEKELETVKREVWTVVFYLARSPTKNVKLSYEHVGYIWLDYENALKKLTFETAKETLREEHKFLIHTYNLKHSFKRLDNWR